jgi:O-acetyl-ADP-ribose deacetylase (regulator of RNase III)
VLHTVGPNRDLHSEAEGYPLLHAAYRSCLARVVVHDVRSVALSCVSTGAYRFPSRPAAHVALSTVRKVQLSATRHHHHSTFLD